MKADRCRTRFTKVMRFNRFVSQEPSRTRRFSCSRPQWLGRAAEAGLSTTPSGRSDFRGASLGGPTRKRHLRGRRAFRASRGRLEGRSDLRRCISRARRCAGRGSVPAWMVPRRRHRRRKRSPSCRSDPRQLVARPSTSAQFGRFMNIRSPLFSLCDVKARPAARDKLKFVPDQLYASRDGRRRRNAVGSQRMTTSTTSPKTTALLRQPSIPAARYGWS